MYNSFNNYCRYSALWHYSILTSYSRYIIYTILSTDIGPILYAYIITNLWNIIVINCTTIIRAKKTRKATLNGSNCICSLLPALATLM